METLKLLIADGTEEFRLALGEALQGSYDLRSCWNGKEALMLLRNYRPDVLVLDLMLPELDGISLLQAAAADHITPMVLATTRYLSDYLLEAINGLGVGYLMVKPCNVQATVTRIDDMTQRLRLASQPPKDSRAQLKKTLLALGIPSRLNGYDYLLEAVPYFAAHPGLSITKELYPAVAILCQSKASHVERSIRSAVQTAWEHREEQAWQQYFHTGGGIPPRPTNAEFISRLAGDWDLPQE
ncbi:MAG: response regulator [Oscillospiraceae bacterium]|nr:response regulator [Oscillospiraceae bacterium]